MIAYDKERWRSQVENGRISRDLLERIVPEQFDPDLGGPAIMHPEAARAMSALLSAAHRAGVTELRVKYSYRTFAKQVEKYENYKGPDGVIGTADDGNLAARPGTSNHGWAVAVDFTGLTSRALTWVRNNARSYGFVNDVPSENWHYTYQQGGVRPAVLRVEQELEEEAMGERWKAGWDAHEKGSPLQNDWPPEKRQGWQDRNRVLADARAAAREVVAAHEASTPHGEGGGTGPHSHTWSGDITVS